VQAYGDLGGRHSNDVDILTHPHEFTAVADVLLKLGYTPAIDISAHARKLITRYSGEVEFALPGSAPIDLHWRLAARHYFGLSNDHQLWERLVSVQIGNESVPTLSLEDHFVHVALEALKHGWGVLEWATCLDGLARRPDFVWAAVEDRASTTGAAPGVGGAILFINHNLHTPIPAGTLRSFSDSERSRRAARRIFAFATRRSPPTSAWPLHLAGADSPWRAAKYVLLQLAGPNQVDVTWVRLPRRLSLVYFAVKPARLMAKYLRILSRPGSQT
jgi:hypothetical protein